MVRSTHCEMPGKRVHAAQKSARGFSRSMFGDGWTTGVETSDCGEPLASTRTGRTSGAALLNKNFTWVSCIWPRSDWVTGSSITRRNPKTLSGQPTTPRPWMLSYTCSHDPWAFSRTLKAGTRRVSEDVLDVRTRPKTARGTASGGTVKIWAGRPQWERRIRLCGPTKLSKGGPGLRSRAKESGTTTREPENERPWPSNSGLSVCVGAGEPVGET